MSSTRPLSVLVVDDVPDAADTLATLVTLCGHPARAAHGGREALALAAAEPPDLAVIDLVMPGVDGFAVARALRESASPPLLVALTGHEAEDMRRRADDAGFGAFLLKPLDPDTLSRLLRSAEQHASERRTAG
jgi:CheY-like chemotaxis protein